MKIHIIESLLRVHSMYERFLELLNKHQTTAYQVAKATGISQNTFSDWKKGRSTPKIDKMQKIADYFGVSVDYLLGKPVQKETPPALTKKDERDIERKLAETEDNMNRLNDIFSEVSAQVGPLFDGEPLDDITRELLETSLRNSLEMAKKIAKQKYTPKKYRKD